MDKYLRWFIKYQVYTIVLFTTLLITFVTPALAYRNTGNYALPTPVEDLRLSGVPAVMFASGWFAATVFLIVAIHKEVKRFIYPYAFMLGLDLVLLFLRELYLVVIGEAETDLWSLKLVLFLLIVPYVSASLFALHRLYTVDPRHTPHNEGFVRFNRDEASTETQATPQPAV
ncbi:uncharacterized protein LOC126575684 isoform X1 [Anopheles aquasalis]|uniref:uncharacterized protein LOC126575684 isoform X1 n=1 Tax=Anopheles aquasalis TaxID=42839 RepID=UPI00215AD2A5|nr:uncharacterized protein LOC126575684 isoform X1 [Anopheles aquasalis]